MSRMSARFVGQHTGMSTELVYTLWKEMGLVVKDKFGEWVLTSAGRNIGGQMSNSSYRPVPTFKLEIIAEQMLDFCKKHLKK